MKIRTLIGLAGATAASLVGMAGLAATPAGAGGNGAQPVPLSQLNEMTTVILPPFSEPGTFPNITVTGNCPAYLFSAGLGFYFTSGSAHINRGISTVNGMPNNINAEGDAWLLEDGTQTPYWGETHAWFGQNVNPNGRQWQNETVSFSGTAADGSTVTFSTNPGGSQSSTGTPLNGWGQETITCTPPTDG